jgi:hypothetical protein
MKTALKLTKKQEDALYLLRLDGLRREIDLAEAESEYEKAREIERAVHQYVLDNNKYYVDVPEADDEKGKRITNPNSDYLMNDADFNSYLIKIHEAYSSLYGIDNPINFVYSEPFRAKHQSAERAYMMLAVDFLKISGRQIEAETLEKSIKTYMRQELKDKLICINKSFIGGK